MIEKKTDSKGLLIVAQQRGLKNIEDMINAMNYLIAATDLPEQLRILEVSTDVEVTFSIESIDILADVCKEATKKYKNIQHAVVLNSPVNTVLALLMSHKKLPKEYQLQVFSTRAAALLWLQSDLKDT